MSMPCPKCPIEELHQEIIHLNDFYRDPALGSERLNSNKEIAVFQCYGCKGMWFGAGMLEEILAEKVTILRTLNPISPKELKVSQAKLANCPECRIQMVKKKAPIDDAVICDYCKTCRGTWLDSGEIDDLERKNITFNDRIALFLHGLGIK